MKAIIFSFVIFIFCANVVTAQNPAFYFSAQSTSPDSVLSCPLKVLRFSQMVTFQTSIAWDTTALQFVGLKDFNLLGLDSSSFGMSAVGKGKLTLVWFDPQTSGKSVADSTTICKLKFRMKLNCNLKTDINFSNAPTAQSAAKIINGNASAVNATFTGNSMSSVCAMLLTNAVVKNPNCHDENTGGVNVTLSGGVVPYNFSWSNGANSEDLAGVVSGNYRLTVTDALGTQFVTGIFTLINPIPVSDSSVVTDIKCAGDKSGAIKLFPSGGTPSYTFQWSGPNGLQSTAQNLSQLDGGDYLLLLTDSRGCTVLKSISVGEPEVLILIINSLSLGNNKYRLTAQPIGGTPSYQIKWSTGSTGLTLDNVGPGTYAATLTDQNGCKATAVRMTTAAQGAWENLEIFSLYPNPVTDVLRISLSFLRPTDFVVQLFSVVGQLVLEKKYAAAGEIFEENWLLGALPVGSYFLKISDSDGNFSTQKLSIVR